MTAITPPTLALKRLLVMTRLTLAFVLSLSITSEARAETWNCGQQNEKGEYSNSVTCTYDEATKTFIIEGEGEMGNYGNGSNLGPRAPWVSKNIVHAIVKGNVTSIGERVFMEVHSLRDIKGTENILKIGQVAFFNASSLKSVDFPKVTFIDRATFYGATSLEYAGFASNANFDSQDDKYPIFYGTKIPNCSTTGNCGTCNGYVKVGTGCVAEEDCKDGYAINKESKMCNKIAGCASFVDGACTCDKYYYKKEGGCVYFKEGCGEGWLEKNRECIEASDGCGDGYKDLGGWCNRVIYTPAEAAQFLNDSNNFVTITFRK